MSKLKSYIALRVHLVMNHYHILKKGWGGKLVSRRSMSNDKVERSIIASFSTRIRVREELGAINQNRIHNIGLASDAIHQIVLKPGEILSMFKIVGEAKASTGFKEGPVIINEELKFSMGGGLCQVSTTLFNAVLLANCEILEKHNHSSDIWGEKRFINLGRDATYAFGYKDLKFRNPFSEEISIEMELREKELELHCRVLSVQPNDEKVTVECKVLEELMPHVDGNREVKKITKGWKVESKRTVVNDGASEVTFHKVEVYRPLISYKN